MQKNLREAGKRKGRNQAMEMRGCRIRSYRTQDLQEMAELFYETVHTVNAADYTEEQRNAWADGQVDLDAWDVSFREHDTRIAVEEGRIVGFADMAADGYLDRLYIHRAYQGQGIATALCDCLEGALLQKCQAERGRTDVRIRFTTHASVTARPFFEKRGYRTIRMQQVVRKGVKLTNFVMEKEIGYQKEKKEMEDIIIRKAGKAELEAVVLLAEQLWPGHGEGELAEEFAGLLAEPEAAVFLCFVSGEPAGFAQCQLRHDYVEGTSGSPVGYLEGIYVKEAFRRQGIAKELLEKCRSWSRGQGCSEFASDCSLDNEESLRFHLGSGFTEAGRIICFIQRL